MKTIETGGRQILIYAQLYLATGQLINSMLLAIAAFAIWRRPTQPAYVLGAFWMTAMATITLALWSAQGGGWLALLAKAIQGVQLATLLPFIWLLPGGQFRPRWLRWATLAFAVLLAFYVFSDSGRPLSGCRWWVESC